MKTKKLAALVAGISIVSGYVMFSPAIISHADTLHKSAQEKHYTIENSGLQLQAVNLKTGKVIPTTPSEKKAAKQSFAVTFHGYSHSTYYNGDNIHQLKNQDLFHSYLQYKLYNYLLNPNNRWKVEENAIELHGGDRGNNCAYWVSTALNWIGANIPYTSYCGTLRNELANNGWVQMTNFDFLRAGDVCFSGDAHTYIFMGWANKSDSIAWVADSQYGWFGNNVHVRSTWEANNININATTDFWGAPGADYSKNNVNTTSNTNPDYQSYNVGTANTYCNVRSGPSTSYNIIGSYSNGQYVQITNESGDWWEVNYNGQTGYVYKPLINGRGPVHYNSVTVTNPTPTVYTSPQYAKIGAGKITQYTWAMPSSNWSGGCVATYDAGQSVTITGYTSNQSGNWYRVNYEDGSVWIPASRITTSLKGKQYPTIVQGVANYLYGNSVSVSQSPSSSSPNLGSISNGSTVNITGKKDGFYRIDYGQTSGWVPVNSLDNPDNYSVKALNSTGIIKSSVGYTDAKNIPTWYGYETYTINNGTKVNITGEHGAWYRLNVNGTVEWVPKSVVNTAKPQYTSPQYAKIGAGKITQYTWAMPSSNWSGGCVATYDAGQSVTITGYTSNQSGNWYRVNYEDGSVWIPASRINASIKGEQFPTIVQGVANYLYGNSVSVSESPSSSSPSLGSISNGSTVNITGKKDGFYRIDYGQTSGWVPVNSLDNPDNYSVTPLNSTGVIDFSAGYTDAKNIPTWYGYETYTISNGTKVNITGEHGDWYRLNVNGDWYRLNVNGTVEWVLKARVSTANPQYTSPQYSKIGTGTVNQYTWAMPSSNWNGECVTTFDVGQSVTITGQSGNWYRVNYEDGSVWIPASRINASIKGEQFPTIVKGIANYLYGNSVSVSESPSSSSQNLGSIPNGSTVNITGKKDGFYRIDYGQTSGWVPVNSLDNPDNYSVTPLNSTGVIDFSAGYTDAKNIPTWYGYETYTINNGTKVNITGEHGNWYKLNVNGTVEWVLKDRVNTSK